MSDYPAVLNPDLVGEYDASAKAGGGYVWDEVLEYRVWCYPREGANDRDNGADYYYAFEHYAEALDFQKATTGAQRPLALILQKEYIDESEPGVFTYVKEKRVAEWPVEFLSRPKRSASTIPDFMSPDAPANKLDILRGNV